MLAQEDHRFRPRQDAHIRRQPELQGELPDDPVAERVERGDRRVRVAVRHELIHANLHLVGGLVREGERKNLRRPRTTSGDQPGNPPRDDLRLAGSGTGDNEQRPVAVRDSAQLLRVQAPEECIKPARRLDARPNRAAQLPIAPYRNLLQRMGFTATPCECHVRELRNIDEGHAGILARRCDSLGVTALSDVRIRSRQAGLGPPGSRVGRRARFGRSGQVGHRTIRARLARPHRFGAHVRRLVNRGH